MMMLAKVTIFVLLASLTGDVYANVFLGRNSDQLPSSKASLDFENALLGELEKVLGTEHRTFTERRLSKIEQVVRPIFTAMPRNEHGKLGHGAASYVLHRLFVQRHAWFIQGLEPGSKGDAAWNETSPLTLFEDRVPEYVQTIFEQRIGGLGMGVHEIAVLAATLEHLVHKEAMYKLQLAYKANGFSPEDVTTTSEAINVLDTYMAVYILGCILKNKTAPSLEDVRSLSGRVQDLYPTWPDTQEFMREVRESVAPHRDYLYFSDVATVTEEAGERYGRWQDAECRYLKDTLLAVEDTGPGGAGRIRLADFYGLALNEGNWQFTESLSHLRRLGALDESHPDNPRVIVANYVNGLSNCVASSSFYSVCCINECEGLLAHLEQKLARPEALPSEIVTIVESLLSPTQQTSRQLSPWLRHQLDIVAAQHDGLVPLHGRLFLQWMHFAYPRECEYPHVSGTIDPIHNGDAMDDPELARGLSADEEEMRHHFESMPARIEKILNFSAHEELELLSMEEELIVWSPHSQSSSMLPRPVHMLLRGVAFVAAVVISSLGLVKRFEAHLGQTSQEKFYV